jgi:TetR/AcrR family transcriptional regulator, transcriptional repressor for nem operon
VWVRETAGRTPLEGLRRFWFWMCEDAAGAHRGMGCLIVNSAVEVAPHDPGIRQSVQKIHREIEKIFLETLKRAQADGELAPDKDVQAIARFLTHSTQGIRVMAKVNPTKAFMRDVAEQTLSVLD